MELQPVLGVHFNRHGLPLFTLPAYTSLQSKVYGAKKLTKHKAWIYPGWHPFHTHVVDDIKKLLPEVVFSSEALNNIKEQDEVPSRIVAGDVQGYCPVTPFYDHQKDAFVRALWNYRYGLFLGRGLGKTKIIIDLVRHLKSKDPGFRCLVLALRVNLYTWQSECAVHSGGELRAEPLVASGPKQREKRALEMLERDPDIIVITYDTARVAHDLIKDTFKYDMIVADESHRLRGSRSKQTKAAFMLAAKASRRVLLTGTASLGDPRHLWGQLKFLAEFYVPNYWHFEKRYTVKSPHNNHITVGFRNMHLLNKKVAGGPCRWRQRIAWISRQGL